MPARRGTFLFVQPPIPEGWINVVDYHLSLVTPPAALEMRQRTPVVRLAVRAMRIRGL